MKEIFDRTAALFGLVLSAPLLSVVALLVRLRMGGPVLFRQQRVGQYGRLFTLVKFRTMAMEHDGVPVSVAGESRITPLGTVLRRYKIDELPELWNVLKGDMSIVGPRPDVPGYADRLQGEERKILLLKPGLTGPATLKYRHEEVLLAAQSDPRRYNDEVIWPDKVRLNLEYYRSRTLCGDLRIILCTLFGGTGQEAEREMETTNV